MGANPKTKGASGEREIAGILNAVVNDVRRLNGQKMLTTKEMSFQRNQNQSAVGGSDLSNPFNLDIEVKRQEGLAINTWWKQCLSQAKTNKGIPILIFRQNRKKWRVMMVAELPPTYGQARVELDMPSFLQWFREYYAQLVNLNETGVETGCQPVEF